jgi:hypothetical protein
LDVFLNQLEALSDDAQELRKEYDQAITLLREHGTRCNVEDNENQIAKEVKRALIKIQNPEHIVWSISTYPSHV